MNKTSGAYGVTKYSILAFRPAAPQGRSAITWYAWDKFAENNGILDKNGNPSRSKVNSLVKHHILAATKSKCVRTFQSIHHRTGKPIYRRISRYVVTERCPEQMEWTPEKWQEISDSLYRRSQSRKARKKRK